MAKKADYYRAEVHGPALLNACGDVRGLRVLDLGCGEGYFSRTLAAAGARVTGIDVADELIQSAQLLEREGGLGIEYRRMSASDVGTAWDSGNFEIITACMSMQDMGDPAAVMVGARSLIEVGERFIFSVPHPGTDMAHREWERGALGAKKALKLDRYFDSGVAVCSWHFPHLKDHWETPYWRRTLSEWTETTHSAGFQVARIHEPRPSLAQVRERPEFDDCYRLPYFLIFDLIAVPGLPT
jgi:SAM-dependent methyltransferase